MKNHFKEFRFPGQEKQEDIIDKLCHDIIEASCAILEKVNKTNKNNASLDLLKDQASKELLIILSSLLNKYNKK